MGKAPRNRGLAAQLAAEICAQPHVPRRCRGKAAENRASQAEVVHMAGGGMVTDTTLS